MATEINGILPPSLTQFLGILCMACGSPALYGLGGTNFFLFVVVMTFILTFVWVITYLLNVKETLQFRVPWLDLEFYYTAGATAFYFIAMVVEFSSISGWKVSASYEAAAVFALFNTLVYGVGAFLLFKDWNATRMANATTTTTTTTTNMA